MAVIISFKNISDIFSLDKSVKFCLLDTNYIISFIHKDHKFNKISKSTFESLSTLNFRLFITHTSRTEFLDIERKYSLTNPLIELYDEKGRWKGKIKHVSREIMKEPVERIMKSKPFFDFLNDRELKDIKKTFFAYSESGKVGWINFCEEFLNKSLPEAWELSRTELGLNYIDIRAEEKILGSSECLLSKTVNWDEMVSLAAKTGMGTFDAMIGNAFLCSKFTLLVTTDLDLAYGLCADKDDTKYIAIPDAMYDEHRILIKKIHENK